MRISGKTGARWQPAIMPAALNATKAIFRILTFPPLPARGPVALHDRGNSWRGLPPFWPLVRPDAPAPWHRRGAGRSSWTRFQAGCALEGQRLPWPLMPKLGGCAALPGLRHAMWRSEEHTSELQSLMRISYAVFCLKKKKNTYDIEN